MNTIIVNPEDKNYYLNKYDDEPTGFLIYPYPVNGGYHYIDRFIVYCEDDNLEQAIEILVAYLCKDVELRETYLRTTQELEEEGIDPDNDPYFDEYWLYIDATMEDADQPYYMALPYLHTYDLSTWQAREAMRDSRLKESYKTHILNEVTDRDYEDEYIGNANAGVTYGLQPEQPELIKKVSKKT